MTRPRLFSILLLSWIVLSAASSIQAVQADGNLTLRCCGESLRNVLKTVSDRSGTGFVFQDDLVEGRTVTCTIANLSLDAALDSLLSPLRIGFKRIPDGPVVLYDARSADRLIHGWVVDASSGTGLPFANIRQHGTHNGTTSDREGHFTFRGSGPDSCVIRVSYIGYAPEQIRLTAGTRADSIRIALREHPIETPSIEVAGERIPDLDMASMPGRIDFSPGRLEYIPSPDGGFGRMVQMLPGADAAQDQASVLNLDGGYDLETIVFLDGIPLYQPGAFYGFLSPLHPRMFEKATLWKAGSPARYGDQTGGIVELTGNTVPENRFNAGAGADLFSSNAFVEGPIAKGLRAFVGARSSHPDIVSGAYYRPIYQRLLGLKASMSGVIDDQNPVHRYAFRDMAGKLSYSSGGAVRMGLTFFLRSEENRYRYRANEPEDRASYASWEKLSNSGLSLAWEQRWNGVFRTSWTAALSGYFPESQIDNFNKTGSEFLYRFRHFQDGQNFRYRSVQLDNEYRSDSFSLNFGYEWRLHEFRDTVKKFDQEDASISPDYEPVFSYSHRSRIVTHIAYVQNRYSPIHGLDIFLGLRAVFPEFRLSMSGREGYPTESGTYEWVIRNDPATAVDFRTRIDPRLAARFSITDRIDAGLAYATCHQFVRRYPAYEPKTYPDLANQWEATDVHGKFITSRPLVLDLQYRTGPYELRMEGRLTDYPGVGPAIMYGESTRGVEWTARKATGAFTGWISYRLNRSVFKSEPPESRTVPSSLDRPRQLKAVSEYRAGSVWFSITGCFASGIPYTVQESVTPELTPDPLPGMNWIVGDQVWHIEEIIGPLNGRRLPAFRRVDLQISKRLENRFHLDWTFGISILNVFDWKNVFCRDFYFDSSKLQDGVPMKPVVVEVPSLGFTPMVNVGVTLN